MQICGKILVAVATATGKVFVSFLRFLAALLLQGGIPVKSVEMSCLDMALLRSLFFFLSPKIAKIYQSMK